MKKKLLSSILMVLFAATLLTGCGGNGDKDKDEKVSITVPDRVLNTVGTNKRAQEMQDKFDELYGDEIEVTHVLPYASSDTDNVKNLTTVLASHDGPAYVSVSSTMYMKDLYNMGVIRDISEFVKDNEEFKKLTKNSVEAVTMNDGSIIAYPTNVEVPLMGFYNDALIDAGYDPETFTCETWDEYYEIVKKLDKPTQSGSSLYASEFFLWPQNWFLSNGAQVVIQNDDGTIDLNYTDKRVVETVEFLRKLYQEGLTNSNPGTIDLNGILSLAMNKKCASFTMYPSWISNFENQGIDPEDITLCQFPKGPSGDATPVMYVAGYAFNSQLSDAELEAAIKYVTFMQSEEAKKEGIQFAIENGSDAFTIPCIEGLDWWSHLTHIPDQWITVTKQTLEIAQGNRINATGYSTYISARLPDMVTGTSNIEQALKETEQLTRKEWLNDYNENITKK